MIHHLLSPFPPRRRWALLLLVVAGALCAPFSAFGASAGPDPIVAPPPRLPAPTGVAPVGVRTLALVDRSRRDPFAPRKDGERKRAVVVSLWYPAGPSRAPLAHYAPRRVLPALVEDSGVSPAAAGLRTHARTGAPMAPGIHPLLLFSPGYSISRLGYQQLAEELASHGYLVAAVDHTYESPAVLLPGGRVIPRRLTKKDAPRAIVLTTRVADLRFVLRTLRRTERAHLDAGRIGVFGHSLGGATAANVMLEEPGVRAGADLDGSMFGPVARLGLDRPFLLLRANAAATHDPSLVTFHARLTAARPVVDLPDARHLSFGDLGVVARPAPASVRRRVLGTIDPSRAIIVQRAMLVTFFDQALGRAPAAPLPAFPEAVVEEDGG
jgi:predicted dienelactone hydrolase